MYKYRCGESRVKYHPTTKAGGSQDDKGGSMEILVITDTMSAADMLIRDIREKYPESFERIYKQRRIISLKNGDTIKMVSEGSHKDGMRADVAIGLHAEIYTHASKQDKRIWTIKDLFNHVKNIHQNE